MAELGTATFAASVRSARTANGPALDPNGLPRLVVAQSVNVTHTRTSGNGTEAVGTTVEVYGPGDVAGISPTEILRVFPASGEPAAEPNYLASIEFDSPELPWLVSLSTGPTKVRPWIALVVVTDDGTRLAGHPGSVLQWLQCRGADLPPSADLWAWAHAHAVGNASVTAPAAGDGRATLSRLLCPTKLQPNTRYLAAVVPTYAAGVAAARRQDPSGLGDQPSWKDGDSDVALPVYHHWRFATGPAGDFEQIARLLQPMLADKIGALGRIPLHLADDGLQGVPGSTPLSALRTLLVSPPETALMKTDTVDPAVKEAIRVAVDPGGAVDEARVVRPPRYGQWPAGDHPVEAGPAWYGTLNLSPSHRVLARLGADLIRIQQEELVAEARRQLGEYRAARRARDLLRLGEMTATRLHTKAVATVADERVVALARPALQELVAGAAPDVVATAAAAGFGLSLLAPAFTRISQRAAVVADVRAAEVRADFVTAALDGNLFAPAVATARPPIDLTRTARMFTRANLMDHPVAGLRVAQLLQLAPSALAAQQQLVTEFAGATIEVQQVHVQPGEHGEHGQPGHGHVVGHGHGNGGEGSPFEVEHGHGHGHVPIDIHVQPVEPDHGIHIEPVGPDHGIHIQPVGPDHGIHIQPIGHQLQPGVGDAVVVQPVIHAFGGVVAAGGVAIDGGALAVPIEIVNARVSENTRHVFAEAASTATSPMLELAQTMGVTQAPATALSFTDLVVDTNTVAFAAQLQPAGAKAMQFDARSAVRRNLGLPITTPILRDQLSVDLQQRFDQTVGALLSRRMSPSVKFADAPAPVTLAAVAAPCRPGLRAEATYLVAAERHLPFAEGRLPTVIHMGFVPKFDAPLVNRLDAALNRWVLAGADKVPPNTITVVETNPAFIEAFIAGANHEMARELLWRDVPSDPRGTVFERFWNVPEVMPEIHTWQHDLGMNLGDGSPYLCVLLRSPLLRRFPNAVIYAARGAVQNVGDEKNFEPLDPPEVAGLLHTGAISPDLTYSVIALKAEDVEAKRNDPHPWYLLLGEPVTEPRFGLDATADPKRGVLNSAAELAWGDESPGPVLRPGDPKLSALSLAPFTWGTDAGNIAAILHQDPFRLVLPAADYLPKGP